MEEYLFKVFPDSLVVSFFVARSKSPPPFQITLFYL